MSRLEGQNRDVSHVGSFWYSRVTVALLPLLFSA
jgi:hypothetical protein